MLLPKYFRLIKLSIVLNTGEAEFNKRGLLNERSNNVNLQQKQSLNYEGFLIICKICKCAYTYKNRNNYRAKSAENC